MGIGPSYKSCYTNEDAPAPNPSPERFDILQMRVYSKAYILYVKYLDCTNFEGMKIMVYEGKYVSSPYLDPHFQEIGMSPIARFRPTARGWLLAEKFAESLGEYG